ncbi:alpha-2-macroglobulin family protein [Mucilaginibacter gynuensis]|uniref:Alpha-2-macroglobulin family protein n=1 Tax=Mucilaginibacter gynuensis TaxID=1302236 RepID=A0ABP8FUX3_9SPHI
MLKNLLITPVLLILLLGNAFSQIPTGANVWPDIESDIKWKNNLQDTRQKLLSMQQKAIKTNDDITHARCLYSLLKISDQITEDSLYFRNSAFIDTLLNSKSASLKLKTMLHLLQAQRLAGFGNKYLRFKRETYQTPKLPNNYAALSNARLDSMAYSHIATAAKINPFKGFIADLLWLSSTPDVFLFDGAGFKDVIYAEQVAMASKNNSTNDELWIKLPSPAFRARLDSVATYAKNKLPVLASYQQWMQANKGDEQKVSFIESLARKYAWMKTDQDSLNTLHYTRYLNECLKSPYPAVKAHGIYQLCLLWNKDGKRYYSNDDESYSWRAGNSWYAKFNTKYKNCLQQALKLYNDNEALLSNYRPFYKVLYIMKQQILAPDINIDTRTNVLPGKSFVAHVKYKNTAHLYYRLIPTGVDAPQIINKLNVTKQLLEIKPVAENSIALPGTDDFNTHVAFLKLPQLAIGHYHLIFSDSQLKPGMRFAHQIKIEISNIASFNDDNRVYVVNRETGVPIPGADVKIYSYDGNTNTYSLLGNKTVVADGSVIIPYENRAKKLVISNGKDTTEYQYSARENDEPDDIYEKDEDDNEEEEDSGLAEYYEDNIKVHLFTDRSIYRPGQQVHYKALFITKNPETDQPMLLSRDNLKPGYAKKNFDKWIKDIGEKVMLENPFSKTVDSAAIAINEFGSFAGTFTIPKTAATGDWEINVGGLDMDYQNRGEFKVEEYKRPTFELVLEKPRKMVKIGEPFNIKIKAHPFSGANMNNLPVKYTITRYYGSMVVERLSKKRAQLPYDYKLIDSTGTTDANGDVSITINDSLLKQYLFAERPSDISYSIKATATDATGETIELSEYVSVPVLPVKINIKLEKLYDIVKIPGFNVTTTANFEGNVDRKVEVKLYKLSSSKGAVYNYTTVDQWLYPQADWQKWFPHIDLNDAPKDTVLVWQTTINTAADNILRLPAGKLSAGEYQLIATCNDGGELSGKSEYDFSLFNSQSKEYAGDADELNFLPVNSVKPGDVLTWHTAADSKTYSVYQVQYIALKKKIPQIRTIYQHITEEKGIRIFRFRIPADAATGKVLLARAYVKDNYLYTVEQTAYLWEPREAEPEIIVEKYRKVMVPGAKESITLSVKTKSENVAAEILTTLYDVTLDKLNQHQWSKPNLEKEQLYLNNNWERTLVNNAIAGDAGSRIPTNNENGGYFKTDTTAYLQGKVSGLNITNASGLNEVVVVAYGVATSRSLTSSMVTIRGNATLAGIGKILTIVDGVVVETDLKDIDASKITEAIILKGADASALYGARAAQGVLVISTKGRIVLPQPEPPVVKVRKNFNETAFFFPQVHADAKGYYTFSFTMPESATEWNWKILAHTRNAKFAYAERKLQTQLNLMVQPNIPRLLYQGDKIKLQSRVSNLDTTAINGTVTCKIEDAVTGEDITAKLVAEKDKAFNLGKKSSGSWAFMLNVPASQTNPLKIVISAATKGAADAEEHIIPVASSRLFIRQSLPLNFNNKTQLSIPSVKLPVNASLFGIGLSIGQKPQATLINALPWLANYSYNCAEQTFNKLRAQATAVSLIRTDTSLQAAYSKAASAAKTDTATAVLPDELADETMPWLGAANQTAKQQKQLLLLFDTLKTNAGIKLHQERLYKLQQGDGGLAWFDGGKSSDYISAYVLAGVGQMKQRGWYYKAGEINAYEAWLNRLTDYVQQRFTQANDSFKGEDKLYLLYALGYWRTSAQTVLFADRLNEVLTTEWRGVDQTDLERLSLLIINTLRYTRAGSILHKKALSQLESIRQQAIVDNENGMRWKALADADELNNSAEETVAMLSEAFGLAGKNEKIDAGIIKWLLTAKTEDRWSTTKGTAAAIGMLQKQQGEVLGKTKTISAVIAGKQVTVSDGLLDGVPSAFIRTGDLPSNITFTDNNQNTRGAVTWYYFAEPSGADTVNKVVKISRQLYIRDKSGKQILLQPNAVLKTGDKLTVKLSINAGKRLKFVYINDPRSAAFEPNQLQSGYEYGDGLSYYQSVRDAGMQFFTEAIPRGVSTITYDLVVAHEGQFTAGPVSLQCMYQPSIAAYSSAMQVTTTAQAEQK